MHSHPLPSLRLPHRRILPGFAPTLGTSLLWLGLIILLPLAALVIAASRIEAASFLEKAFSPEALSAYGLSVQSALVGAGINAVLGTIIAWVLVRYRFPGRTFLDILVDLPFALPGAVGGIALATVFADSGWIGTLVKPLGWQLAYNGVGLHIALVYAGIPFVVRSVQPVLENLDQSQEEAARLLGARSPVIFARVILPAIVPAILTGATMAFSRGLGEYGTAIFISSNIPLETELVSRHMATLLENYDIPGATAVAAVTLAASLLMLVALNLVQSWQQRRERRS